MRLRISAAWPRVCCVPRIHPIKGDRLRLMVTLVPTAGKRRAILSLSLASPGHSGFPVEAKVRFRMNQVNHT